MTASGSGWERCYAYNNEYNEKYIDSEMPEPEGVIIYDLPDDTPIPFEFIMFEDVAIEQLRLVGF